MRYLIAFVAVAMISLGACNTTAITSPGSVAVPTLPATTNSAVVNKVQAVATKTCGFLPSATTVANILTTFVGYQDEVGLATKVATTICNAVLSPAEYSADSPNAKASKDYGEVNGVPVKGKFVGKSANAKAQRNTDKGKDKDSAH